VVPLQAGLLDWVNDTESSPPAWQEDHEAPTGAPSTPTVCDEKDFFGDSLPKKQTNILHIGYQNIGGMSFQSNSIKDDVI
jgi:hypothetical protein